MALPPRRGGRERRQTRAGGATPPRALGARPSPEGEGLARPEQPDRLVALEEIEQVAQRLPARRLKIGIAREREHRILARRLEQRPVDLEPRHAEPGHAALPGPEQ